MVVWGGVVNDPAHPASLGKFAVESGNGGAYDPETDRWSPVSSTNAPSTRESVGAVWTGSRVIVWGGGQRREPDDIALMPLGDGALYDSETDAWEPMRAAKPLVSFRRSFWTGNEMLVWAGTDDGGGAAYDPTKDSWRPVSQDGAPARSNVSVWTGSHLLVPPASLATTDGGVYDAAAGKWTVMAQSGLSPRAVPCAVWTGSEMILWGGAGPTRYFPPDGARFAP